MSRNVITTMFVNLSESRNPFVEHAVEYAIAAAHATFDKDKKDMLHKLLLKGNACLFNFAFLS